MNGATLKLPFISAFKQTTRNLANCIGQYDRITKVKEGAL